MARLWALGLAALPLVACKPKVAPDAPARDVRSWTIAEIEAELAHNDQVLAGEGIMVAMAAPAVAPATEPGPAAEEPASEEHVPSTEPEPVTDDGDGPEATEPAVEPPEPEPTPTVMPQARPYEAELLTGDGAGVDAERHRGSRRRMTARSRRETSTRCERVCRLAEATCELETQICELAARHPDEPRYEQACIRAEQQCVAASQACQRCED